MDFLSEEKDLAKMVILLLLFSIEGTKPLFLFSQQRRHIGDDNIYSRSIKRTYIRIDSDLEKFHMKSVTGINYTTKSSIRVKSCRC